MIFGAKDSTKVSFRQSVEEWATKGMSADDISIYWDGCELSICNELYPIGDQFDSFILQKGRDKVYIVDLRSKSYWFLSFKLKGKQLIRNKKYRVIDFYS